MQVVFWFEPDRLLSDRKQALSLPPTADISQLTQSLVLFFAPDVVRVIDDVILIRALSFDSELFQLLSLSSSFLSTRNRFNRSEAGGWEWSVSDVACFFFYEETYKQQRNSRLLQRWIRLELRWYDILTNIRIFLHKNNKILVYTH